MTNEQKSMNIEFDVVVAVSEYCENVGIREDDDAFDQLADDLDWVKTEFLFSLRTYGITVSDLYFEEFDSGNVHHAGGHFVATLVGSREALVKFLHDEGEDMTDYEFNYESEDLDLDLFFP